MPIYLNKAPYTRLPKGKRRIGPVRASRRIALDVRHMITRVMGPLANEVENILPWLMGEATPAQAAQVMRELQDRWRMVYGADAQRLASKWVTEISTDGRKRLEGNIARSLGLDMTHLFDDKTVMDAAELMSVEARALITSIPEQYLAEVQQAVTHNFMQLPFSEGRSLTEHIQHLAGLSDSRARLIARDQTSKINTAINQARQTSIGIEEYIWRTARDRRVTGNPSGPNPKGSAAHGNHYAREGKRFRWDHPPADGHPGYAINCRCVAEPIIDVNTLKDAA